MSYNISFRLKIRDHYIDVRPRIVNVTWNVGEMIRKATGLEWKNEQDNGLCVDIIPHIERGLRELTEHRSDYVKYESPNGWGTIDGTKRFFEQILSDWNEYCLTTPPEIAEITTFWIE